MPSESILNADPHIKLSFAIKQLSEQQSDITAQWQQQAHQFAQHNEHLASLTSILETRLNHGLQESSSRITQTAIDSFENKVQNALIHPLQHLQKLIESFESTQEHSTHKTQKRLMFTIIACGISMLLASGMTLFFCHYQEQTAKQNLSLMRYGLALKQAWPRLSKPERAKILGEDQAHKKTL